MRAVLLVSCLLALFAVGAQAWWCTGHMVIAEIARQNLDANVEAKVNAQFTFLNQWFQKTNDMVSGACWSDDLKSDSLEVMEGWHFINQPYNPDNVPINPWPIQNVNVETNIMQLSDTLKKDTTRQWITAFAVANLVHFYGDIHQPLHATELFDSTFPKGDKGGNDFHVTLAGTDWRLHFIWDSVCGQYQNEPNRPLSPTDSAYIKTLAGQYMANFSVPEEDKKTWNSTVMAEESFVAAVHYAYDNHTLTPNSALSDAYIERCKSVAGFRIAYAGYRLASDLNYLFRDDRQVEGEEVARRVIESKREYREALRQIRIRSQRPHKY